ncbi:hypothetical protein [Aeromonas dhakensis]|uniref:hypothetical protein n=1 Tax=Aeromonas dhakensis TaxID=196024 RepID=UPI0013DDE42B|nr:hypothetical protein [Aeromonas dhakensis]MBL0676956.1 hypothetical protein [Aeromonas dhakensis]MDH0346923.1 hypothetical protein [Aeromonas dhakensis]MDX7740614.1 hypothetical protein [Aeromonas dhakensis]HDX8593300.1 hypothetical protein [Aeromonas dhakensis]
MKDPWEGRTKPSIEHITSLFDNDVLGAFLAGHLVLESVLVLMLETTPNDSDKGGYFDWSFYRKINAAEARGLIHNGMACFLHEVNGIRNRLAHKLDAPISFDEAFCLAQKAAAGGVDFSDDTIHSDRVKSAEWYGIHGIVQEVFQNASQDLLFLLEDDDHITNFVSTNET